MMAVNGRTGPMFPKIAGFIRTHPAACLAAASATYAIVQMCWLVFHDHTGIWDQGVVIAWVTAVAALFGVHPLVTPTARPRAKVGGVLVDLVPRTVQVSAKTPEGPA